MKKRVIIIPLVLLLAGGAGAGGWYYFNQKQESDSEESVSVDKVSNILGIPSYSGNVNRFAGVVEPQKTESIELISGLKVKQNFVKVGDEVNIGDKLFEYDTDDAQNQITQLEIDIENEDISIESDTNQIKELEKYRDKAKEDEKLSITTQIMTTQNSIKRYEYEKKSKTAEMESLKKQIANAVVYSEFQGIVKTINTSASSSDDSASSLYGDDGSNNAYMTIMSTGEYRIKGKINEQNMMQIRIGTPVIIHSRVDESQIWRGEIQSIDKEHASTNSSDSLYGSSDESMTSSSTYPFYVEMESSTGLMLGQHVYIEEDNGQNDINGIWLEDYYFITDEEGNATSFVWAANDKNQLEKRELSLGEYDEDLMSYEVLSGLSLDDYITFPDESYKEGMSVIYNDDVSYEESDDWYSDDSDLGEEYYEEEIDGDELIDEGDDELIDEGDDEWIDEADGEWSDIGEVIDDDMDSGLEELDEEWSDDEDVIDDEEIDAEEEVQALKPTIGRINRTNEE